MKKLILPVLAALTLGVTSCGGPSLDDINVAEIKDACGCVDAVKLASDVMIAEAKKHESNGNMLEPDEATKKLMDEAAKKIEEITTKCTEELKVERETMKKCPSFKELEANMKNLQNL